MKKFNQIKSEERKKFPNLNNIEGTIAKIVEENSVSINKLMDDPEISDESYKAFAYELLEKCKQTPYVNKAKDKVESLDTKQEICFYLYQMMLAGENLSVI